MNTNLLRVQSPAKTDPGWWNILELSGTNTLPQRRKGVLDAWLNIYEKDQYLIYSLAWYQEGMLHLLLVASRCLKKQLAEIQGLPKLENSVIASQLSLWMWPLLEVHPSAARSLSLCGHQWAVAEKCCSKLGSRAHTLFHGEWIAKVRLEWGPSATRCQSALNENSHLVKEMSQGDQVQKEMGEKKRQGLRVCRQQIEKGCWKLVLSVVWISEEPKWVLPTLWKLISKAA